MNIFSKKVAIIIGFTITLYVFWRCHKNAVTGKTSMTLIPENELIGMSEQEYQKFLKEHPPLPDSDPRVRNTREMGIRIQKAVEEYYASKKRSSDLAGYKWEYNVVDDPTVNAWCMPGGKVVVYTGILPITQNDDALAAVMGHEIAHAVGRHGNQRMSQALLANFGLSVLSAAMGQNPSLTSQLLLQSVGIGTQLGILKFSRNHETEADKMGLIFAAMAGYNPEAVIDFWKRMSAVGGQKPPEFVSTHPSDETRIRDLQNFMPEAKKYYRPRN
ncbi:MAG: M48 family metallopeptidase [Bacteroidia bacterium]|nr:M48 family metallopeptidase [Bacteroidia bacterium]